MAMGTFVMAANPSSQFLIRFGISLSALIKNQRDPAPDWNPH